MEKGILQIIKEIVIKTIAEQFEQSEVYGEEVPQNGSKNCFGVSVKSVEQKPLLKGRREQWITMNVEYRNDVEKREKAESIEKVEILYDVLSLIGEGKNKFFFFLMQHNMTEKGFQFEVTYYVQIMPVVTQRKMERLEYNGSQVVGY